MEELSRRGRLHTATNKVVEELTPRAAAKKYGALIPAHVKIVTRRPAAAAAAESSVAASRSRSAERGNEKLGVPDKHEFYEFDPNYENYKRTERSLKRKAKKMKKKTAKVKTHK